MGNKLRHRLFPKRKSRHPQADLPLHQAWEVEQLRKLFSAYGIDCVFDVGANHGQYAKMLREQVGYWGKILSFEPHPVAADKLGQEAESDPDWHVFETGLSARGGVMDFNLMADSQFSSFHAPRHNEAPLFREKNAIDRTVAVEVEPLSRLYPRLQSTHGFSRPFLKMDTQGHDRQVIAGALEVLDQFIGLQSELSVRRIYRDSPRFDELIRYYESLNFVLSAMVPNNAGHFPYLVEIDCIMLNAAYLDDPPRP